MSLQLIGAGFGRTGTASLKFALETLGIGRCYHMSEVLADPSHIELWLRAERGEAVFEQIFDGFSATVDFPACIFWRELMETYPDAKVLLSVRDPERWYRSTQETILSPHFVKHMAGGPFGKIGSGLIGRFFDGELHDHDHLIRRFNEHVESVRSAVPADQLLVYEVKQGWEPLCEFLDVPVPGEAFPHVNSEEETRKLIDLIIENAGESPMEDVNERLRGSDKSG
jgi:hypothetical protein